MLLFDFLMPSCEKNVQPIDLTQAFNDEKFDIDGMEIVGTYIA